MRNYEQITHNVFPLVNADGFTEINQVSSLMYHQVNILTSNQATAIDYDRANDIFLVPTLHDIVIDQRDTAKTIDTWINEGIKYQL